MREPADGPAHVSPFAWWSLGLGVLSVLPCFFVYFIPALSAVLMGVLTERQLRRWPGYYSGRWQGRTGLGLGVLSVALGLTAWILRAWA